MTGPLHISASSFWPRCLTFLGSPFSVKSDGSCLFLFPNGPHLVSKSWCKSWGTEFAVPMIYILKFISWFSKISKANLLVFDPYGLSVIRKRRSFQLSDKPLEKKEGNILTWGFFVSCSVYRFIIRTICMTNSLLKVRLTSVRTSEEMDGTLQLYHVLVSWLKTEKRSFQI